MAENQRLRVTVVRTAGYRAYVKVESIYPEHETSITVYADEIIVEELDLN